MRSRHSRFSQVSRRAFVSGASLTALAGLAACSGSDTALTETPAPTTPAESTSTAPNAGASTAPASGSSSEPPAATQSSQSGAALPASARLDVTFTVAAASSGGGGRGGARNPYVAVWVETTDGTLVQTISLWHLAGENDRWLSDLRAWYTASGGTETNSSATRAAGSYTVAWDLTDTSGAKVAAGDYVLCIEGAREHGSYELIQQPITLGSAAADGTLEPSNDIEAAAWKYSV